MRETVIYCDEFEDQCDMAALGMLFYMIEDMGSTIIHSPQLCYDVLRCLASLSLHFDGELRGFSETATIWALFKDDLGENFGNMGTVGDIERQYVKLISGVLEGQTIVP